jgi:SPP1 gp7 family putative phage head morphogenesis protein
MPVPRHDVRSVAEAQAEQAFIRSMEQYRSAHTVDAVESWITHATPPSDNALQGMQEMFKDIKQGVFNRYGRAAAGRLSTVTGVDPVWDINNPRVQDYLDRSSANRVNYINQETQKALRNSVTDSFMNQRSNRTAAIEARKVMGLNPRYQKAVSNMKEGLAKTDGVSVAQANARSKEYAERLLKARARMIARTEVQAAINAAEHEAWAQAVEKGIVDRNRLQRIWLTATDERTCPTCGPMNHQVVKFDEWFSSAQGPLAMPPVHPNCRCRTGLMVQSVMKALLTVELDDWSSPPVLRKYNQNHDRHGRFTFGQGGPGAGGGLQDFYSERPITTTASQAAADEAAAIARDDAQIDRLKKVYKNATIMVEDDKGLDDLDGAVDGLIRMGEKYPKVASMVRWVRFTDEPQLWSGLVTVEAKPVRLSNGTTVFKSGAAIHLETNMMRASNRFITGNGVSSRQPTRYERQKATAVHEFGHVAHMRYELRHNPEANQEMRDVYSGKRHAGVIEPHGPQAVPYYQLLITHPSVYRRNGVEVDNRGSDPYGGYGGAASQVRTIGRPETSRDVATEISGYAAKNPAETVADGWAMRHVERRRTFPEMDKVLDDIEADAAL